MGSRVRIRLFHIFHFVMHFLFPLLKNCKSGVDDRGHRLRSGSPVTNLPGAASQKVYRIGLLFTLGMLLSKQLLLRNSTAPLRC